MWMEPPEAAEAIMRGVCHLPPGVRVVAPVAHLVVILLKNGSVSLAKDTSEKPNHGRTSTMHPSSLPTDPAHISTQSTESPTRPRHLQVGPAHPSKQPIPSDRSSVETEPHCGCRNPTLARLPSTPALCKQRKKAGELRATPRAAPSTIGKVEESRRERSRVNDECRDTAEKEL